MKGKNIARITIVTLIIIFIALYLTQVTGYYEYTQNKKVTYTKEAIEKFEKDLKQGKKVKPNSYIKKQKNYNNKASKLGLKISSLIEGGFNKTMESLFKEVDKAIKN